MSNRNIKIIAVILATCIAACTVSNCYIRTHAAEIAVSGYTAEKVLAVLLAVAGVALSQSDYQIIWQDGQLDTSALLNNMQQYSRLLYNAVSNAMYLGAAGVTKITLQQDIMSLLKTWARQYFGTNVGDRNIFGTLPLNLGVLHANTNYQFVFTNGYGTVGTWTINANSDFMCGFANFGTSSQQKLKFFCFPTSPMSNGQFIVQHSYSQTAGMNAAQVLWQTDGAYHLTSNGHITYQFWAGFTTSAFPNCYVVSSQLPIGVKEVFQASTMPPWSTQSVPNDIETYYVQGNLGAENIDGNVIDNDGQAATLGGVIGAGTMAALDALGNVVLSGQATLTLPSDETMEDDLTDVVTGVLPWSSFLEKLGLIAITGSETVEQINEQAQSLPTPSYNGAYTLDLTNLFPFCIPFDIVRILSAFNATPQAPHFTWELPSGYRDGIVSYTTVSIDLAQFETVAQVVRVLEYISFVLGLALITRDLIRG